MIDLVLLAVLVLAGLTGWRVGGTARAVRLVGLILGLLVGLASAGLLSAHLSPVAHLLLSVVCALGGALLGSALGRRLGGTVGRALPAPLDRALGAATRVVVAAALFVGAVGVAVAAGVLPGSSAPTGTRAFTELTGALGRAAPGDVQALVPAVGTTLPSGSTIQAVSRRVGSRVLLVSADGCSGGVVGSGFVAGSLRGGALVVTNAHVVHRATHVTVSSGGRELEATPVVFDARADLAVLRVPGLDAGPLTPARTDAANGTAAVSVGYPAGGSRTAIGAVIEQRLPVTSPDFAHGLALHQAYRLRADIEHGDSGSPLLDTSGRVVGVVNALLGHDGSQGYAITLDELRPVLTAAARSTGSADTGAADPNSCAVTP